MSDEITIKYRFNFTNPWSQIKINRPVSLLHFKEAIQDELEKVVVKFVKRDENGVLARINDNTALTDDCSLEITTEERAAVGRESTMADAATKFRALYDEWFAKRNMNLLRQMEFSKNKDDSWRSAVQAAELTPSVENPADWNLSITGVPFNTEVDGVPAFPCYRAKKLHRLLKLLSTTQGRHLLITGPPQSGKSAMALLFNSYVNYVKSKLPNAEHLSVYIFSLTTYEDLEFNPLLDRTPEDTLKRSLDIWFLTRYGITLLDFEINFAKNPNCIVILDETQRIYHHKKHFWTMLKAHGKGTCSLVALSAFTSPKNNSSESAAHAIDATFAAESSNDTTPPQLHLKLPYAFVAFTESEFKMTVSRFVDMYPDAFASRKEEAIAKLKDDGEVMVQGRLESMTVADLICQHIEPYVISPMLSDGVPYPDGQRLKVYHPGLTYSLLMLLLTFKLAELDNIESIYNRLTDLETRCFPNFVDIQAGFCKLDKFMSVRVFWFRFRRLLYQLINCDIVRLNDLELPPEDLQVYRKLLVRHALCCSTPKEKEAEVHLSCALVNQHFRAMSNSHSWRASTQANYENIDQYIMAVVSNFSPKFPNAKLGVIPYEKAFQDQFFAEGREFSRYKLIKEYPTRYRKQLAKEQATKKRKRVNISKQLTGEFNHEETEVLCFLAFFINSRFKWGIELVRNSRELLEHVQRFEEKGKYFNIGCLHYRVLDCVHLGCDKGSGCVEPDCIKGPNINEYKLLTQDQANHVLTAEFASDFSTVTFKSAKITTTNGKTTVEFIPIKETIELQHWTPLDEMHVKHSKASSN